jgi:Family of unknown function (DUF6194)
VSEALEPEEILGDLLRLEPGLRRERYYGERALFYNPGGRAPLGTIFCSIKDRDGPNDKASKLSRPAVYRFAFEMSAATFERRFGPPPRRPPKGRQLALPDHDLTRVNMLTPHPVYGWMRWVQILAPTAERFEDLRPLLAESLTLVREKFERRPR